jgi:hypothetical protein
MPYSDAETERAIRAADYYQNARDRRRMSMMGLR